MVLFNLPRPWILVCGKQKRPREIQIATYKILNRTELCECSLTAGTFSLDETLVQCTPEIRNAADGIFSMSYAINKIIFDYLQVNKDVTLERDVLQALSELLTVKPQYDWSSVQWHENPQLLSNVINNKKPRGFMQSCCCYFCFRCLNDFDCIFVKVQLLWLLHSIGPSP